MPIYQTIVFACEVCDHISSVTAEAGLYDDPVIEPPKGETWKYIAFPTGERLLCPECLAKHNQDPPAFYIEYKIN